MKRIFTKKNTLVLFAFLSFYYSYSQVGIGTTAPRGAVDIASTTQGLVFPNVALVNTITETAVNPQGGSIPTGTVVYNTATSGTSPNNVAPGLYYWNGSRWIAFAGSPGGLDWSLTGNSGTTAGTNFLGTTDAQDLRLYTNNVERARILSTGNIGVNSAGTASSQIFVEADNTEDAVAGINDDTVGNAFWGRNSNSGGTAIIGAANGLGGVYPTKGAGVAGSAIDGHGISGMAGNGAPNNTAHDGNSAGYFSLDSDNNPNTNNSSAFALIAGKTEINPPGGGTPLSRSLFGGYFVSGIGPGQAYAYVGTKYDHDNTGAGGTNYKILGDGTVSTIVKDKDNNPRIMFAPEAPEVLFQDYGIGKLVNGTAVIKLDEILSRNILVDNTHPLKVFIQLEGDCNGVYVTNKSDKGFTVKELQNGNSDVTFSWQIVATRANSKDTNGEITSHFENLRFPIGPKLVQEPGFKSKEVKKEETKN
ncbi:hypothetical protein [Mesoflavibacter sp. CH_XMU1404-2]|uniref:hypothetical protein n=1 Tax=Mesoflavibacter sp. CH_XMU1404-2 TaxID=3107766 RepID=UPI00300B17A4